MADERTPEPGDKPEPSEEDLEIEEDSLDDGGGEADDILSAPTEEHPAPEGAMAPESDDDEPADDDPADDDPADDGEPPRDEVEEGAGGDGGNSEDDGEDGEDADEGDEGDDEDVADEPEADDQDAVSDDEQDEGAEQKTSVLAAVASRLPRMGRGGRASGEGDGGKTYFGRPRRRFPLWARFILGSLVVITSIAAATAVSLILYLTSIANALAHNDQFKGLQDKLAKVQAGAPETIMIVGSDHRKGQGAGHGLSDTTILIRLDPSRHAISLFSIPRDLEVSIPGYGTDKFNAAYSLGGPQLSLETVKQLTGLQINHIVNVDFLGFAKAVSAIGCVYVDVDRRYYHSNQGLAASAQYSEINVRPGYQRLCGTDALEYVRYRHTDNDIVRNARQQDFVREARARVPASDLLTKRHDLIKIFTQYTTSDISDFSTMLDVIKLFIAARSEPIKEVHFPGTVGANVTATPAQIHVAVRQFLGEEGSSGPRGSSSTPVGKTPAPEAPPSAHAKGKAGNAAKAAPVKKPTKTENLSTANLEGGNFGRKLALRVHRKQPGIPIYYPTTIVAGSQYAQDPRAYSLVDSALAPDERAAYKYVLKTPNGEYYGLQGLSWKDPPILNEPHETRQIGDRTYNLYYDNDRLRLISWETDNAVYWVSNSLLQSLSADQMVAIARGAKPLTATHK